METAGGRAVNRRTFLIGVGATAAGVGAAGMAAASFNNGANVPQPLPGHPPLLDLPRIEWEGGPAYWGAFPKAAAAGWTDPSFFPLAVFFGRPAHADQLKSVGINTFQAVEHNDALRVATSKGIFCIVQDEFSAAEIGDDPRAVGLFAYDECDMGLSCGGEDTETNLANMHRQVADLRARNDGRFINANYSKGVLETWWALGTMDDFMGAVDVASVDNYAYTSPDTAAAIVLSPHWPAGATPARAATYGWLVDRMRSYQAGPGSKPNWMFVETAMPFLNDTGARTITPEQIEGACWSAIIHEARGICFFQHNNDGVNGGYSLVDCSEERKDFIRRSNAKITALAPVINTQSYAWDFGPGLDTMLKAKDRVAYVFAEIALGTDPGSRTFTLPPSVSGTTIEVVDEGRSVKLEDGRFVDEFAHEYTHHIYRIAI
ncbi:hypothetical protein [Pseudarthrobacter phenanthrenivorans]|uniref:hypothetical protein n=1 Tax=Pseudarthrobacter phenanthrenivorans TaxID=361575 RepID=UPI00217E602F|nr:hypothetical protein [Pseudarthrobacter phenanthrenivorans]